LQRHRILHLDLKPSNVIAEAGRAKLIDLSLARPPGTAPAGIGTWQYLAPEQARGGELGPPADVWGLGTVLFEIATGEAPFDDDPDAWSEADSNGSGTYSEAPPERYPQLERPARRPEQVRPVPLPLADAIAGCLQPEPANRPSIEELLGTFEYLAGLPPAERRWSARPRLQQR
jgi:serine/threonine protein kinase